MFAGAWRGSKCCGVPKTSAGRWAAIVYRGVAAGFRPAVRAAELSCADGACFALLRLALVRSQFRPARRSVSCRRPRRHVRGHTALLNGGRDWSLCHQDQCLRAAIWRRQLRQGHCHSHTSGLDRTASKPRANSASICVPCSATAASGWKADAILFDETRAEPALLKSCRRTSTRSPEHWVGYSRRLRDELAVSSGVEKLKIFPPDIVLGKSEGLHLRILAPPHQHGGLFEDAAQRLSPRFYIASCNQSAILIISPKFREYPLRRYPI